MNLRLPSFFRGMSWVNKAGYLVSSGQARDFSHACSILAALPRKPRPRDLTPKAVADLEKRKLW